MSHVYRRPFDYARRRQRFDDVPHLRAAIESTTATGAFVGHAATVTSSGTSAAIGSSTVRSRTAGIYRKPWPYEQRAARNWLIYTAAEETYAVTVSAAFVGRAAIVQASANAGATVDATADDLGFTAYAATVAASRDEQAFIGAAYFVGQTATIDRTAGLGGSRVGAVGARSMGGYVPGSMRGATRGVRGRARIEEMARRK